MSHDFLNIILIKVISPTTDGYVEIIPIALSIAYYIIAFEVTMIGIYLVLGGDSSTSIIIIFRKGAGAFVWIYIISKWEFLSGLIFRTFSTAGLVAGHNVIPENLLFNPSAIMKLGFGCTALLFNPASRSFWDAFNPIDMFFYLVIGIIILATFFVIALNVFMVVVEFYIFSVCSVILLPFALFDKSAFLAETAIAGIFRLGIKVMVLGFVLCISYTILQGLRIPRDPSYHDLFTILFTTMTVAVMCGRAPGMAASMMTGTPNLAGPTVSGVTARGGGVAVAVAYIIRNIFRKK